ncbi:MAG: phage terminase small subunit P27 family [Actinobacteria bacterium]|nr:phage terminase small subunit P27 family [Actinomycetota bacterium]
MSKESKEIWAALNATWMLEPSDLVLLQVALEAYDRYREAWEAIQEEGLVVTDPSGRQRANPLLQVEKEARLAFFRAWKQLGFNEEPPGPLGRPPGR